MDDSMDDFSIIAPFLDGQGRLTALPAKNKKKLAALWYLAQKIQLERVYTESEINDLLDEWTTFHDPATLRREQKCLRQCIFRFYYLLELRY